MSKKFQLQIPEPCHEDWNKMTPVDKGRFCNSCDKAVVDFTGMSDAQLIAYFKKPSTGSLCGRFNNDQINRDFEIPRKRIPWLKYFFQFSIPIFLTGMKSQAQGKLIVKDQLIPDTAMSCSKDDETIVVTAGNIVSLKRLSGRVVDEIGNGIPYATVYVAGAKSGAACDSAGFFEISILPYQKFVNIIASSVGYTPNQKEIKVRKIDRVEIKLKPDAKLSGEVVVTGYGSVRGKVSTFGSVATIKRKRSYVQKVKDYFIKDSINIFPNPAKGGMNIKVQWNKAIAGDHTVELYNLQGQLIKMTAIKIEAGTSLLDFVLPQVTPGSYMLHLTNKTAGKKHIEKIIIQ